jgi:hypothetical protein
VLTVKSIITSEVETLDQAMQVLENKESVMLLRVRFVEAFE